MQFGELNEQNSFRNERTSKQADIIRPCKEIIVSDINNQLSKLIFIDNNHCYFMVLQKKQSARTIYCM